LRKQIVLLLDRLERRSDVFSSFPRRKTSEPCPAALMNVVNL